MVRFLEVVSHKIFFDIKTSVPVKYCRVNLVGGCFVGVWARGGWSGSDPSVDVQALNILKIFSSFRFFGRPVSV